MLQQKVPPNICCPALLSLPLPTSPGCLHGMTIIGNTFLGGCSHGGLRADGIQCGSAAIALFFRSSITSFAQRWKGNEEGMSAGPPRAGAQPQGYLCTRAEGGESGPACLILFVFQCETRSIICLKWLIGIFCLVVFFLSFWLFFL